jgi:L-malate glycosyltransferase
VPAAVHQLVPVLARGDAISGCVLRFQRLLRAQGIASQVFASLTDPALRSRARPVQQLHDALDRDDAVMYHLSIGSRLAAIFAALPARRVVYYHNVTPAESLDGASPILAHHLRWGRADLALLARIADLGIAPSAFSAAELRAAGARRVAVVPLAADVQRLAPRRSTPAAAPVLLFVGRFAPHKRQDFLIRVLAGLKGTHAPDATLVLAGAPEVPRYIRALEEFAARLGVRDAVSMHAGRLDDRAVADLYARASAFLCASDHEGFCVPVLEAMSFSVPVLAYADGAVAETVGGAGVVLQDRDPLVWSQLAWRLSSDDRVRERLVGAGSARLLDFSDRAISARLVSALAELSAS